MLLCIRFLDNEPVFYIYLQIHFIKSMNGLVVNRIIVPNNEENSK